jgi:membrane protein implicated in regulation of membrane protease activity
MTPKRLWLVVLALVLAAVLAAPVTCSQSSSDDASRCSTGFGYWTPFGEWVQGVIFVALVLSVVAAIRRKRTTR